MKPIETNTGSNQALTTFVSAATGVLATALTGKFLRKTRAGSRKRKAARIVRVKGGMNHG